MSEEILENELPIESMDDYKDELEASFKKIKVGDILTGTIIAISETDVTVDLKYYTEGIIKVEDLSDDPTFLAKEQLSVGDEISATVTRTDDGEGHILLSKKEANSVLAWDKLNDYLNNHTMVPVKISECVSQGAIAYLEGIRGFIPASKLDAAFVEDTSEWLGRTVDVTVITANKEENRLVLSAKESALMKVAAENNKKLAKVSVGTVLEGTVDSIKNYGAFIELENGLSGLLHVSQITDKRIKSPAAVLKEGQKITVKIIAIENGKLSLSMKALLDVADTPAEDAEPDYEPIETEEIGTGLGALLKGFKL
ncbi:MAG: S1 RNA-binding domain-containing protein [Lachnospiraceae bacterium]|nr:S1 RNA-binding domain-containing protein [Lachnospiraceae bacterium]